MNKLPITNIDKWNIEKYGADIHGTYYHNNASKFLNSFAEYFYFGVYLEHYFLKGFLYEGIYIKWDEGVFDENDILK